MFQVAMDECVHNCIWSEGWIHDPPRMTMFPCAINLAPEPGSEITLRAPNRMLMPNQNSNASLQKARRRYPTIHKPNHIDNYTLPALMATNVQRLCARQHQHPMPCRPNPALPPSLPSSTTVLPPTCGPLPALQDPRTPQEYTVRTPIRHHRSAAVPLPQHLGDLFVRKDPGRLGPEEPLALSCQQGHRLEVRDLGRR